MQQLRSNMRSSWYDKIPKAISYIIDNVLNETGTVQLVYKKLNIPNLLKNLGQIRYNCLVIGDQYCWLVNSKPCHENHFMGTERKVSLTSKGQNQAVWMRIKDLVKRFAAPGSIIEVFVLNPRKIQIKPVAVTAKKNATFF